MMGFTTLLTKEQQGNRIQGGLCSYLWLAGLAQTKPLWGCIEWLWLQVQITVHTVLGVPRVQHCYDRTKVPFRLLTHHMPTIPGLHEARMTNYR
jgi:hypothetical protein